MNKPIALLLVLALIAPVWAQDKPEPTVVRTYDIRILTQSVADYPLQPMLRGTVLGGDGSGGSKTIEVVKPDKPAPTAVDELVRMISMTVAPESWRDNGGTIGSCSQYNGLLVVTQTPANHKAIEALLSELTAKLRKPVRVEATWLLLTPDQLTMLRHPQGQESITLVPDDLMKSAKVYSRGQVTGFNGQLNHIASTVERNFMTDLTPVVGTGCWAFDPMVDRISSGVGLQFRPQLAGEDSVVLDVYNEMQETTEPAKNEINVTQLFQIAGATTRPGEGATTLDRPRITAQSTQTSLRMPLASNVLVGGVTLEPGSNPARELYLVVRVEADKK